jgi:DNA-binding NarL/FixJ family response regulator
MRENRPSATPTVKRRILLVDSHPLARRGLTALLESESGLAVCAAVATRLQALEAIAAEQPDLVIVELFLEEGDGPDLVKAIRSRHAELPVLVLSLQEAPAYAERALQAGASGYVSKREMGETLLDAVRCVLDGKKYARLQRKAGPALS